MKKTLFTFLLLFAATAANAQTIVKGDMDGDGDITITDVTGAVDVILGKAPKQTISQVGDPYAVDNSFVVGTWRTSDGETLFTLSEDGSTNYPGAVSYKFRPYQGTLMFFDTQDKPVKTIVLNEVDKGRYLLAVNYVTDTYTYYYRDEPDVNYPTSIGIDVISGSSTINVGESVTLYARFTPENAEGTVNWTCNNESIVNYSKDGKNITITGTAAGTATFTATLNEDTSISNDKTITIKSNDPQPTTYWYAGQNASDMYITSSNYQTIATQDEFTTKTINMIEGNYLYLVIPSNKTVAINDPAGFEVYCKYYNSTSNTYRNATSTVDGYYIMRALAGTSESWTIVIS